MELSVLIHLLFGLLQVLGHAPLDEAYRVERVLVQTQVRSLKELIKFNCGSVFFFFRTPVLMATLHIL